MHLDTITGWILTFNHEQAENRMLRGAVYRGIGYGEFLISGIFEQFEALRIFNEFLREQIQKTAVRTRTETYLNATSKSFEIDRIDPKQTDLHPIYLRLVKFLGRIDRKESFYRQKLEHLSDETRRSIREVYASHESFVKSDFSDYFREFLAAQVCDDQRRLGSALTSLLEMEGLLSAYWVRSWQQKGLHAQVAAAAAELKVQDFDAKKPTLFAILAINNKLVKNNSVDLLGQLGSGWSKDYADGKVASLRNDVAHGRLFVEASYLKSQWGSIAEKIGLIGQLYNTLKQNMKESNQP